MGRKTPVVLRGYDLALCEANRKGLMHLLETALVLAGVDFLWAFVRFDTPSIRRCLLILCVCGLLRLKLPGFMASHPGRGLTLGLWYGTAAVILLLGMGGDIFNAPEVPAFAFPVLLICLPLFITDRGGRVIGFLGAAAAVFLVLDGLLRPQGLFLWDVRHLAVCGFVSIMEVVLLVRSREESLRQEEALRNTSLRDALTGLYNKRGVEHVYTLLEKGVPGALILMDLDHFKEVNDTAGHAAGDRVLAHVGAAMRSVFRASDILMRIGGDEFAVYAAGMTDRRTLEARLDQLRAAVAEDASDRPHVTCSLGAVTWSAQVLPSKGKEMYETLFRRADAALYKAKEAGRDQYSILE